MQTKIFDFLSFYFEKKMRNDGFKVKRDSNKKIKIALKLMGEKKTFQK
jgi:hypothetical protein